ncbi:MAG: heme exporter protein CcmB, partial [Hasllibacter sp.]
GGGFGLALAFFAILTVLVPFAVGPDPAMLARIAPGVLWLGALLACLLSLDRMLAIDAADGSLELLAVAPLPLEGAMLAKTLAHWIVTGLPLAVLAPALGLLLSLPGAGVGVLTLSLLIGTLSLSAIGAFGAALTAGVTRGGLLLALIVLPLYVPTLILGAEAAARAARGAEAGTPLLLLGALTLGALAVMPFAGAAALRVNLR